MSKKILRPDLSLRDNIELNKLLTRAARERATKHLTRIGLNVANVQNVDVTRSRVPLSQRREDYVRVEEWNTRDIAEQFPSIRRAEREETSNKKHAISSAAIVRRMFNNLPQTIAFETRERELRIARLDLIKKLETIGFRETGKELRTEWFPGSF